MKRCSHISALFVFIIVMSACLSLVPLKVGPPKEISIELTPERIERGRYLAFHVTGCIDCHSRREWKSYSGPLIPGTEGMGGVSTGKKFGIPGTVYAMNITPFELGDWTDGEIVQAITAGVNRKGRAIFPIMPYLNYAEMSKEDVFSIVAFLRTLKPIPNKVQKRKLNFFASYFIRTIPRHYYPRSEVDDSDAVRYGEYLTTIAACISCHTRKTKLGRLIKGMEFAGGVTLPVPGGGIVISSNITPDHETGIGDWTKVDFIERFKEFASLDVKKIIVPKDRKDFNTIKAWTFYASMTETDLGSIYLYLMSLKPVKNKILN